MALARLRVLLPALWAGMVLCVGFLAAPASFATLPQVEAGRMAAQLFTYEAHASLAAALFFVMLERRLGGGARGGNTMLALAALFCTVAGHFAVQPMMAAARAGHGTLGFGTLHGLGVALFALKGVLLLVLAWRCAVPGGAVSSPGRLS
jgi:Domain of unknown function (DUF4149)